MLWTAFSPASMWRSLGPSALVLMLNGGIYIIPFTFLPYCYVAYQAYL